ncbi:membrane-spanning 4-domains subfamily A member 4D-like [Gouania willdenowi]|uniref:Membrane-spanning 4-domains subfamily A member 4D-like n=1 Tax=Gouania willdenowi TaxID=441366 RepID=A0A8C5DJU7_GOUWI|nr:membrane-spanning 4-domains subfamily A member 4D-like [Gouania willdenowi]XP_028315592.1 membrane-spanning 4-domains subfamily A member 4D-like [Gouania willdenowi]
MEDTESPVREGTTAQEKDRVLMSNKPLHRFLQKEPRSLGIVLFIFGCAELLMGFQLVGEEASNKIYVPFWLGTLFVVSGICSIYADLHPTKKTVTICLSSYMLCILGITVAIGYRVYGFTHLTYLHFRYRYRKWDTSRLAQVICIESILFISSLCAIPIFIFLCVVACFALKSSRTQVIVQCIPAPPTTTSD